MRFASPGWRNWSQFPHGLRRLAAQAGSDFQSGIVFYDGTSILPLDGSKILAVPLELLWEW